MPTVPVGSRLEAELLEMIDLRANPPLPEDRVPIRPTPIRRPPKPSTKISAVWWRAHGIPQPESEYRFAPPRRWRFDYCWRIDGLKVALEIDGAVYSGGRHTRGSGFIKDQEKTNVAALLGWFVIRCVPADVKDGSVFRIIRQALKLEATCPSEL
jgi:hypothetical protein